MDDLPKSRQQSAIKMKIDGNIFAKNDNQCKGTYPNANKLLMQNHPR